MPNIHELLFFFFFFPFYLNRDFLVTCSDGILSASGKTVQLPLQLAKDLATLQVSYFLTDKLFLNSISYVIGFPTIIRISFAYLLPSFHPPYII